jgi:hypothetical protein
MPSHPRNIPEQEHSIKERSNELFFDETSALPARSGKPFAAYLRETPARPVSPALTALFWILAVIVGVLFLAAIWRVAHRHGGRPPAAAAAEKTAMSGLDTRSAAPG